MKTFISLTSSFLVVVQLWATSRTVNAFTTPSTSSLMTRSPTSARPTTSSSTKCDAMLGGGLEALDHFYQTAPYCAAFMTCSVKAFAADWVAQTRSNQQVQDAAKNSPTLKIDSSSNSNNNDSQEAEEFDVLRNLAFVLYGGFYQGMGQTYLYSHVFPAMFGATPTVVSVLSKASFENFILAPFFCLPTVYTMKALLAGGTPTDGISKYIQHISTQHILFRYWSIWFPVQCLNFAVVPEHLRVPFGACVSFFWVCLLSSISAREGPGEETVQGKISQAAHQGQQPPQQQQDIGLVLEQAMAQVMEQVKMQPLYQQVTHAWATATAATVAAVAVDSSATTVSSTLRPAIIRVPAYNQTLS